MAKTDHLKIQHKEIVEIVKQIETILSPEKLKGRGDEARKLLISLSGKLMVHLATEDKNLYPEMVASSNEKAGSLAREYMQEMGTIGSVFKEYLAAWPTAKKIEEDASEFCEQTKKIFAALKGRIQREESTLYPLADSL